MRPQVRERSLRVEEYYRQPAVRELSAHVDAVVIVGDVKSANTKRLTAIAS